MKEFLTSFVYLFAEMAPYLLLGFLIAGILHAFVPQSLYRKWLAGNDAKSVFLSLLFGIPLPLCSCGVIPTAVSMRKEGASKGATTAFLIGTPQTGVDSIAATYSVLGLPFAIIRPLAALVSGFFGGCAVNMTEKDAAAQEMSCTPDQAPSSGNFWQRCRIALRYGFSDMIQDIGRWLVIGLVLAGLITILVPDDFFASLSSSPVLNMLVILLIAVPMYVCATGSIPIAAALILKGMSPGAALVFLMAGPASNLASIMVLGKTLGRRTLVIYLLSIVAGAVLFGLGVDYLLPREWFTGPVTSAFHSSCCLEEAADMTWWQIASSAILAVLLIRALFCRFRRERTEIKNISMKFKVTGMMCNHCSAHVKNVIAAVPGVESVEVDLAGGTASVSGSASAEQIISAVTACGYGCEKM